MKQDKMMICPDIGIMEICATCTHSKQHLSNDGCKSHGEDDECPACIPYEPEKHICDSCVFCLDSENGSACEFEPLSTSECRKHGLEFSGHNVVKCPNYTYKEQTSLIPQMSLTHPYHCVNPDGICVDLGLNGCNGYRMIFGLPESCEHWQPLKLNLELHDHQIRQIEWHRIFSYMHITRKQLLALPLDIRQDILKQQVDNYVQNISDEEKLEDFHKLDGGN